MDAEADSMMETFLQLLEDERFEDASRLVRAHNSLLTSINAVPDLHPGLALVHYCAFYGDEPQLRFLLDQGVDVNLLSADGVTALHLACATGLVEIARFLLEHGADPNARDPAGRTPAHYIAAGNIMRHRLDAFLDTLKALMDHGVDLSVRDARGRSASDLARKQPGHPEVQNLLENYPTMRSEK